MLKWFYTGLLLVLTACGGGGSSKIDVTPIPQATGKGVFIFIVDTGVRRTHVDFNNRVFPAQMFIPPSVNQLKHGDCLSRGHGTSVASLAAGTTWGVAKEATVVPVMVVNCLGQANIEDLVEALDWIAATPLRPAVVNLSLGGPADLLVDAAITRVIASGITVVTSAGNNAEDACNVSPARVPEAITVGALDQTFRQASFSNYGSCVDFYLPGVDVFVAHSLFDTGIGRGTGTSFSAPVATGWVAKILEQHPQASPTEVQMYLQTLYQPFKEQHGLFK